MERLTKTELRALLESIKERYPNSDLATFSQRVFSRLAKKVPSEIISHNGIHPRRQRNARATQPHHADPSSRRIFRQRAEIWSLDSSAKDAKGYTGPIPREGLSPPGHNIVCSSTAQRQVALNRRNKDFADHDQLLLRLRPHASQAYRDLKTVTQIKQKFILVDHALNTLRLGLILLTPDGKVRLATTCAAQQVKEYLGQRPLIGERLPESLWMWVKQQEAGLNENSDAPLRRSRLILAREGKRLVIRLVSDLDRILLLREEHSTKMIKPQSAAPCSLSPREAQVLQWVSQGKTNKEAGVILKLSARTVQKHLEHIYQKMGVESRTGAAAKAYEIASTASK